MHHYYTTPVFHVPDDTVFQSPALLQLLIYMKQYCAHHLLPSPTAPLRYFQAYRIDHVLGFLRIWEIPGDCTTGLLGRFRPSEPIWKQELEARGIWDLDRCAAVTL